MMAIFPETTRHAIGIVQDWVAKGQVPAADAAQQEAAAPQGVKRAWTVVVPEALKENYALVLTCVKVATVALVLTWAFPMFFGFWTSVVVLGATLRAFASCEVIHTLERFQQAMSIPEDQAPKRDEVARCAFLVENTFLLKRVSNYVNPFFPEPAKAQA